MLGRADHADDLAWWFFAGFAELHSLTDRIFVREIFLREGVVDQQDRLEFLLSRAVKSRPLFSGMRIVRK